MMLAALWCLHIALSVIGVRLIVRLEDRIRAEERGNRA